ncbi:methylated-DNA--[protein]-cysteine S-methyltransferase [Brevirhabdus sp.]|uniref:methylated-DNA--[protein]-cysteine S-methyltransferase n=1 Tax=Brevirhabdus sp. TaxID=2004514 RepID=UPI004059322F
MMDGAEPEGRYHYQLMRRAIEIIDDAGAQAPPLCEIAQQMHMSPAHFQRLFSQWAGVSPKRYQQWLTLEHAKALLETRHTTLQASVESGLSGGGRLHDLFVTWEAMSPGQYARKGRGLSIRWGWFDSPFGRTLAMGTDRGLCGIAFVEETGDEPAFQDMAARWPHAALHHAPEPLRAWVEAAFRPRRAGQAGQATPLHLIGAPFQIKVWEALMSIPTGHVTTYSDIATAIGAPRAVRAVGTAVGRNPVSWLIPCHRALRKSGGLGGYHWGLPVKRAMLAWEAAETA